MGGGEGEVGRGVVGGEGEGEGVVSGLVVYCVVAGGGRCEMSRSEDTKEVRMRGSRRSTYTLKPRSGWTTSSPVNLPLVDDFAKDLRAMALPKPPIVSPTHRSESQRSRSVCQS